MDLFERAGGEEGLRAMLRTFYDRVFEDAMIGFFFRRANKERLIDREYELTARALGAPVEYRGRGMGPAHAAHAIAGGHFLRRTKLLEEAMEAHDLAPEVRATILRHIEALRPEVTQSPGASCDIPDRPAEDLVSVRKP